MYKKNQQQEEGSGLEGAEYADSINIEEAKANFENRYRLLESQLKNSMANSYNQPGGPTTRKPDLSGYRVGTEDRGPGPQLQAGMLLNVAGKMASITPTGKRKSSLKFGGLILKHHDTVRGDQDNSKKKSHFHAPAMGPLIE